ncbi:MAG: diguanylate cyclase [Candidatus Aminicenantes bacterium]|nr:diguanylate cyclase [Candidatus Aminicenantes bacterium]
MTKTISSSLLNRLFPWRTKIVFKFMLISIPFLALISLSLFILAPYWYKQNSLRALEDKSRSLGTIAAYSLAPAIVFEDSQGMNEIISSLSQSPEVDYILVFNSQGQEIARFTRSDNLTINPEEIRQTGHLYDNQVWNYYAPINHQDQIAGYLAMGFSLTEVYRQIEYIRQLITLVSVLIFGLGLFLIYIMSYLTTRPLRRMTKTVQEISSGDLSKRTEVTSNDEVGTLAKSFNLMVDRLHQTLSSLQEARGNLEKKVEERTTELKQQIEEKERISLKLKESEELFRSMVENLGEAVVIVDADENFIFANQAANQIFEEFETGLTGKNLKDYLPSDQQQLVEWQTARRKGGLIDVYELEITLKDGRKKTLLVNAVPQFDRAGNYVSTLAVMTDITGKKKEEAILAEAKASLEKAYAELKKNNEEASLLVEMGDALQLASSEEEIINIVINFARQLLPKDAVLFYLRPDKENFMQLCSSFNLKQPAEEFINLTDCWAIRKSSPYFMLDPASELVCPHLKTSRPPDKPVACLPLSSFGENLGLLVVFCCQEESKKLAGQEIENLMASKKRLLVTFSQRVTMALSNFRLRQSLQEQSIRDPLTGLYNRRYLEETLERELLRAKRAGNPVSVIMLDIDHFKKFNDTYGHEAGDLILQAVARTVQKSVRAEDIVCRYGGEEFTVILPGLELKKAVNRAELILDAVRHLEIKYGDSVLKSLTISAGVAVFPDHGKNWPELFQAADAALLQAKSQGRNRVVTAN